MNKRILFGITLLLSAFLAGFVIVWLSLSKTMERMDKLLLLHQVEVMRENLIIYVQQIQAQLSQSRLRSSSDVDALIARVEEMDKAMNSCIGCHHTPQLTQGLLAMHDMVGDYKMAISRLVSAVTNKEQIAKLEQRAEHLGQDLLAMTQGMAFTANTRLQLKTEEAMTAMRTVRNTLVVMLLSVVLLSVAISASLARALSARTRKILEAMQRTARGDLHYRVQVPERPGDEFDHLGAAFNTMMGNLRRSQRQNLQSAKLTAIGELATTIAYKVNNPLTAVLGYTGLMLKADEIPADKKEHLKALERETVRAREILTSLLDFSRRKPPRLVTVAISGIIEDAIAHVGDQAAAAHVEIKTLCPDGLQPVAVDRDELKQVLVHLIGNALLAMPSGGTLTFRCSSVRDDAEREMIAVNVEDTGQGIAEERLDRVFDPFYPLRADSERTGLGLSISYMIVQNHGGRIEVESEVGKGSTFRVLLPVSRERTTAQA
jgi:signal transduction histidine kinase